MPKANKSVYMGTTSISPQQTCGEIIAELVKAGASSINTDYKNGVVCGVRWVMKVRGVECLFEMPIRIEPLLKTDPRQRAG